MKIFADLQIHSRYSRATSSALTLPNIEKWARIKGLNLLGTGDFTHPKWLAELKEYMAEDGSGILTSKTGFKFVLQGEISNIYTQDGKGRRVHTLLLAKDFDTVQQINEKLLKKGRLDYDGRPIFGFTCIELVEMMRDISDDIEITPAHCLPPEIKIHTINGIKPIGLLNKHEKVLTHRGNFKTIKEVYKRDYKGYIYHIKPRYFSLGLKATGEHPFYAIKTLKNCSWTNGICKPTFPHKDYCITNYHKKYEPQWIPASKLEIGDVMLYPRYKKIRDVMDIKWRGFNFKINKDFCRLIGYYLAEGYSNGRDAIGFSFNTKNEYDLIEDVRSIVNKVFNLNAKKGKTKGDLMIYSRSLYKYFEENFYKGKSKRAHTKSMPKWMLDLPLDKQVEIFKGWWYGDKGSTSSRELMNQFKVICLRLGIVPSIRVDSKKSHKLRGKHKIKNRIITAKSDNFVLDKLTFFEDKFNLLKNRYFHNQRRKKNWKYGWIDDNYVYLPILKITKNYYSGFVHNLEVEHDNSYVSEFATIHNCWTPWYGIFGSMSGFDSIEECFKDQTKHIYSIETGLSSDPAMNWRLSKLDKYTLLSSSDAHSFWPWRLGRECNVFDIKPDYDNLIKAIRTRKGFVETIEVDPNYGKYHYDGHRNCNISMSPSESKKLNGICPKCRQKLTIGVQSRVDELADRPEGFVPKDAVPFKPLIPLSEIIAAINGNSVAAQKTMKAFNDLINRFGNEFNVLLNTEINELAKCADEKIADAVIKAREGKVKIIPGYDGVYGIPVFDGQTIKSAESAGKPKARMQKGLDEFL